MYYLVYKGSVPSLAHSRYDDKAACEAEVERLEQIRKSKNEQADKFRAEGNRFRGSAFLHIRDDDPWSCHTVILLETPEEQSERTTKEREELLRTLGPSEQRISPNDYTRLALSVLIRKPHKTVSQLCSDLGITVEEFERRCRNDR